MRGIVQDFLPHPTFRCVLSCHQARPGVEPGHQGESNPLLITSTHRGVASTENWNHGAESNCHCIFSAACGSLTAAHLLALQCRTAIVRPWYKCGAIFIQPLRVILFARRRRPQIGVPILFGAAVTPRRMGGLLLRRSFRPSPIWYALPINHERCARLVSLATSPAAVSSCLPRCVSLYRFAPTVLTMDGNRTRVCSLKGSRTDHSTTTAYMWRLDPHSAL